MKKDTIIPDNSVLIRNLLQKETSPINNNFKIHHNNNFLWPLFNKAQGSNPQTYCTPKLPSKEPILSLGKGINNLKMNRIMSR